MMTSMPAPTEVGDGFVRGGAAVAGHEHGRPGGNRGADTRFAQVVAVVDAVGRERDRIGAEVAERPDEDGGGAHPVHVVVTVNKDRFAGSNGGAQSIDRVRHSAHRRRWMQLIHPRAQVVPRVVDGREPARYQEPGDERWQVQLFSEPLNEGQLDLPGFDPPGRWAGPGDWTCFAVFRLTAD